MTIKELIQSLYIESVTREIDRQWRSLIKRAISKGKLPAEDKIDPAVFKQWAYDNYAWKLALVPSTGFTHAPLPVLSAGESSLGQVLITTNIPSRNEASPKELNLIEQLKTCQLSLHQEKLAHISTAEKLKTLTEKRAKSSAAGKKGGRGKSK